MLSKSLGVAMAACAAIAAPAEAAPVTIAVGTTYAKADKLKPGSRHYVQYLVKGDGSVQLASFQTKTISFDGGHMRVSQRWESARGTLTLDSLVDRGTLRPITHQRDMTAEGKVKKEGFLFERDAVVGIADQPDNSRKDFRIATPQSAFNFEIDMETLQALPWNAGAAFSIPFYHPGGPPPAHYLFKVAGSQKLMFAGHPIDCWVVTTDYNRAEVPVSRFWIAKASQVVVRVDNPIPNGGASVKQLLPTAP